MPQAILTYRKPLHAYLLQFFEDYAYEDINSWGPEATKQLSDFATAGKGIRGSLALFSYSAFSGKKDIAPALPLAAALELFHAGFLIHDDIMDNDALRRGKPSLHTQVGEAVAICMGDLAFFLGYKAIAGLPVQAYVSEELAKATVAQMEDVSQKEPTSDDVLRLYRFKTARYTFSLPLVAGAMLAEADPKIIPQLEDLGESLGLLFQIRDDELDGNVPSALAPKLKTHKNQQAERAQQILTSMNRFAGKKVLEEILDFVQTRTV